MQVFHVRVVKERSNSVCKFLIESLIATVNSFLKHKARSNRNARKMKISLLLYHYIIDLYTVAYFFVQGSSR